MRPANIYSVVHFIFLSFCAIVDEDFIYVFKVWASLVKPEYPWVVLASPWAN